jgi:hypothetical protein
MDGIIDLKTQQLMVNPQSPNKVRLLVKELQSNPANWMGIG